MKAIEDKMVVGLLDGNPKILREIYNGSIGDAIRADVRNRGGGAEDAEDVLVLSILRTQRLIRDGKYESQGKLTGFLRQVASWVWKEELRRQGSRKWEDKEISIEIDADFELQLKSNYPEINIKEEIAILEDKILLKKAISQLSKKCQEVIKLRYFEGYTLVEIGQIMNISQPNVAHFRCLKRLRKIHAKLRKK